MYIKSSVLLVIIFHLFVFDQSCGWVFTEISYDPKFKYNMGLDEGPPELPLDEIIFGENPEFTASGPERFNLIYPGTKWCGAGDVAEGYDDLGPSRETDICCREHDHCPDILRGGESRNNLTNTSYFTRLSCVCDEAFRQCLHSANKTNANRVGALYFNAIGTRCYRQDYPVTGCVKYGGWFNKKCLEYTYDENGEKIYQWFDVPVY